MNEVTRWFDHKLYRWMDESEFTSMAEALRNCCTEEYVRELLAEYSNLSNVHITYYKAGTYEEKDKCRLDNVPDFYEIRMDQRVAKNHVGSMRIYLPVQWNHRFLGITGAGTNTEVDWYTSVRYNVLSWPMAIKNGFACVAADNDTGTHLDCSWGFDSNGKLEWDHINAWAYTTVHEMTLAAKKVVEAVYGEKILASYMHGTSGGARQAVTEAVTYGKDYDGVWADSPAVDHVRLPFSCLWAIVVESNEKHIVSLAKYKKAYEVATQDPVLLKLPFNPHQIPWMDYIRKIHGIETEDGPITDRDLQVMIKTWDGPISRAGHRMGYGFGPTIRQWPLETGNPLYGYFQRDEQGRYKPMPIALQAMRWMTEDPNFDIYKCTYEQFEWIYSHNRFPFIKYTFDSSRFGSFTKRGGKAIITEGTGDPVLPWPLLTDYYFDIINHYPKERTANESIRMFMMPRAGHSILDWSGPAVTTADGMKALMNWVEKGIAPEKLRAVNYDFDADAAVEEIEIESYNRFKEYQWKRSLSL